MQAESAAVNIHSADASTPLASTQSFLTTVDDTIYQSQQAKCLLNGSIKIKYSDIV